MGSAIAQSILKQKGGFQVYAWIITRTNCAQPGNGGVIPDLGLKHLKKCDLVVIAVKPQGHFRFGANFKRQDFRTSPNNFNSRGCEP